jgi:hypothetical protein
MTCITPALCKGLNTNGATYSRLFKSIVVVFFLGCGLLVTTLPAFGNTIPQQLSVDEVVANLLNNNAQPATALRRYQGFAFTKWIIRDSQLGINMRGWPPE